VEKEQTKSLAERGQTTSNQTEPGQIQQDVTKPSILKKQTDSKVNSTESNKISILPKEKVLLSQPIANAGQQQIASSNSQVTLDASKSIDNDGTIISYLWTQVKGPKVLLAHPDKIKSTFQSPVVDNDTILIFRLVVKDNSGMNNSDTVGVKIVKVDESSVKGNKTAGIQLDKGVKMRNST
jgi:K319-like protein